MGCRAAVRVICLVPKVFFLLGGDWLSGVFREGLFVVEGVVCIYVGFPLRGVGSGGVIQL